MYPSSLTFNILPPGLVSLGQARSYWAGLAHFFEFKSNDQPCCWPYWNDLSILYIQHLSEVERALDPFRHFLIQAVQWARNLRDRVEKKVAAVLAQVESGGHSAQHQNQQQKLQIRPLWPSQPLRRPPRPLQPPTTSSPQLRICPPPDASGPSVASGPLAPPNPSPGPPPLKPGRAHRILRERCPACFNLNEWGQPLANEGGDVQLGGDACFSYRRLRKHKVDALAQKINNTRKRPANKAKPFMPQEKRKANLKRYDASGVFVMTCHHGQVIFLCNVDTPGEQQQYIITMLEEVFSMLPPHATVLQAYDVGCVTDHSLNLSNRCASGFKTVFPATICEWISFVINGMHAYGDHWACQLVYSPRFRPGMGLADHEGVKRFWLRIRNLIPLTRGQWHIWMIDQYAAFMHRAAMKTLQECRVPERELHAEWAAQKEAQTSIHAHKSLLLILVRVPQQLCVDAPAHLRHELEKVLSLQTQIDTVEKTIDDTKKTLQGSGASVHLLALLRGLEQTHKRLGREAEELYASLKIQKTFPGLRDLPLEFAQTLHVMRDLKINIRKCAIGSFFEWESLDCAVSGRQGPLGTKLHQSTHKAISKRQPSLLKAIKKFNMCCATLE
ncbi:hypothetical protein MVEN_00113800 [Mycena venus]|uniref:CxC1-like cysteine cluster associated with KDZ transposases domain-containing protein n=1 Tax=Mycena venus TaxID=2733690 RepID=A0A8H7DEJ1_9AGAR|nr:hypothetical protein MVEN_00113800 [Mycena venus]